MADDTMGSPKEVEAPFTIPPWSDDPKAEFKQVLRGANSPHRRVSAFSFPDGKGLDEEGAATFSTNLGQWLRATLPPGLSFKGYSALRRNAILRNTQDYVAIFPFESGNRYWKNHPDIRTVVTDKLMTLADPGQTINILPLPSPAELPPHNPKDKYDGPKALHATITSGAFRNSLIAQQTFAYNPDLTFHVVKIDTHTCSWTLGYVTADIPDEGEVTLDKIRYALIVAFHGDKEVKRAVRRLLDGALKDTDDFDKILYDLLRGLIVEKVTLSDNATPLERPTDATNRITCLVFLAPPLDYTPPSLFDHLKWCMRQVKCHFADLYPIQFVIQGDYEAIHCTVCHLDTHRAYDCQFRGVDVGFAGPTKHLRQQPSDEEGTRARGAYRGAFTSTRRAGNGGRRSRGSGGRGRGGRF
jgi:hypothetical protein